MYILNLVRVIKRMSIHEFKDFIFENYHKRIRFSKENSNYSMKRLRKKKIYCCSQLIEKIPGPRDAKEHYQSFIKKKNTKSVKQSKIIIN